MNELLSQLLDSRVCSVYHNISKKPEEDFKPDGVRIIPEPGICVKLRCNSGSKIFANICTSDKVSFSFNSIARFLCQKKYLKTP